MKECGGVECSPLAGERYRGVRVSAAEMKNGLYGKLTRKKNTQDTLHYNLFRHPAEMLSAFCIFKPIIKGGKNYYLSEEKEKLLFLVTIKPTAVLLFMFGFDISGKSQNQ
jgi:hypothetical protein